MARALCFAACLALPCAIAPGVAAAGPTSKVTLETDPPGAKVYFGLKEDGEKCTTPCTVDAPVGETTIIIEADGRRSIIENLVVPRKQARPIKKRFTLPPTLGTLLVEGPAGATIKIDDEIKGKAPGPVEDVPAGAHHVVVELDGKTLYDSFIEIEDGREATVVATGGPAAPTTEDDVSISDHDAAPAEGQEHRPPWIAAALAFDIGFRQFKYKGNDSKQLQRDNTINGQALAGPAIEVWPARIAGLRMLRNLSLYGRFEYGLNPQDVFIARTNAPDMQTSLRTKWHSLEISARQRWTIKDIAAIEVGGGYAQDAYQFRGDPADLAIVPNANYKTIRIGGRAALLLDRLEPFIAVENRIVLSGGQVDDRYTLGSSVSGIHAAVGAAIHIIGHIDARVEGALTRYSWTFSPGNGDPQAAGGTDSIQNVSLAIGYAY